MALHLTIASIDKVLYEGLADSVTCPGREGEFTVLRSHEPFITPLTKGDIMVREGEHSTPFPVEKGFAAVGREETIILV